MDASQALAPSITRLTRGPGSLSGFVYVETPDPQALAADDALLRRLYAVLQERYGRNVGYILKRVPDGR